MNKIDSRFIEFDTSDPNAVTGDDISISTTNSDKLDSPGTVYSQQAGAPTSIDSSASVTVTHPSLNGVEGQASFQIMELVDGGNQNTSDIIAYAEKDKWDLENVQGTVSQLQYYEMKNDGSNETNDCSSLTGWTSGDYNNGSSDQYEFDGRQTIRLETGTASVSTMASRIHEFGSIGKSYAISVTAYHATVGIGDNVYSNAFAMNIRNGETILSFSAGSNGIWINDGVLKVDTGISTPIGQWVTYMLVVNAPTSATATVDIYLDGVLEASGVDMSYALGGTDGEIQIIQQGFQTANCLTYVDEVKVGKYGTGLPLNNDESAGTDDCTSLTSPYTWTDGSVAYGEMSQETYDGESCFKFHTTQSYPGYNNYARITTNMGTVPTDGYILTVRSYYDEFAGVYADNNQMSHLVCTGTHRFAANTSSDGLVVQNNVLGTQYTSISVPMNTWVVWDFHVKIPTPTTATVDIYKDGVLAEAGVPCSYAYTGEPNGFVALGLTNQEGSGYSTIYMDYIKLGKYTNSFAGGHLETSGDAPLSLGSYFSGDDGSFIDDDCSTYTGWSTNHAGAGTAAQEEWDSRETLKLYTPANNDRAQIYKSVNAFENARYVITFTHAGVNTGNYPSGGRIAMNITSSEWELICAVEGTEFSIHDGSDYQPVLGAVVDNSATTWATWMVDADFTNPASATCDVYKNGVLVASDIDCSRTSGGTNGQVMFSATLAAATGACTNYIDSFSVGLPESSPNTEPKIQAGCQFKLDSDSTIYTIADIYDNGIGETALSIDPEPSSGTVDVDWIHGNDIPETGGNADKLLLTGSILVPTEGVLILSGQGSDTSTTFTDTSPSGHGNASVVGSAQISTDISDPFGRDVGVMKFDGHSDRITYPNHADWAIGSDWSLDMWINATTLGDDVLCEQIASGSSYWQFMSSASGGIGMSTLPNQISVSGGAGRITVGNWHHIAAISTGGDFGLYIDGDQVAYDGDSGQAAVGAVLTIGGRYYSGGYDLHGYISNFRIAQSNHFNAAPVVGVSDTISINPYFYPTNQYYTATTNDSGQVDISDFADINNGEIDETVPEIWGYEWDADSYYGAGSGWTGRSARIYFPASIFTSNGKSIKITFASSTGGNLNLDNVWVGHKGTDNYDLDGNQVQLTFNGGSDNFTIGASSFITSDAVYFDLDSSKDVVVSFDHISGGFPSAYNATGVINYAYLSLLEGASDVGAPTWNTSTNYSYGITSIDVNTNFAEINNYYSISTDARDSYKIFNQSESVWRDIAKDDAGVWKYNNATDATSETWVASSSNTPQCAISEAIEAQEVNRMIGSEYEAISDEEWNDPNGWVESQTTLDLAVTQTTNSSGSSSSVDNFAANYDLDGAYQLQRMVDDYEIERLSDTTTKFTKVSAGDASSVFCTVII